MGCLVGNEKKEITWNKRFPLHKTTQNRHSNLMKSTVFKHTVSIFQPKIWAILKHIEAQPKIQYACKKKRVMPFKINH